MKEELFSEVYSCYYQVVSEILRRTAQEPVSVAEMTEIIQDKGFADSCLYLLPKLTGGEWELLERHQGRWASKLNRSYDMPLTNLQKSWIKAILQDPRIRLFMTEEQVVSLDDKLQIKPLFRQEDFYDFDSFREGDPYDEPEYQERFRHVLYGIRESKVLYLQFQSSKNGVREGTFLPCKMEYSRKDDKFRLYAAKIRNGRFRGINTINMGRLMRVADTDIVYQGTIDLQAHFARNICGSPVHLQIFNQRNALERCMLHFANYQKTTEYEEATDSYRCVIYYDKNDETELLIRILSFGPLVRVMEPESFISLIKERLQRQYNFDSL